MQSLATTRNGKRGLAVLVLSLLALLVGSSSASASMNQASTAFYDAVGISIFRMPIYRGTFTIVPKGSGAQVSTLRWQNTSSSNVCGQKVDFVAYDRDMHIRWISPGAPVLGCRHDFTANRGVNLSSAGVMKICGTLYFLVGENQWSRKVTTCSIM